MSLLAKTRTPDATDNLTDLRRIAAQTPRPGADLPRIQFHDRADYMQRKVDLITGIGRAESVREFGGLYLVHGKYLLEGGVGLRAKRCDMVDCTPVPEFEAETAKAIARNPGMAVTLTRADFREPSTFDRLEPHDVSILYEVLLHQENAVQVVKGVVAKTKKYICLAQPCLREDHFLLPSANVLLQFYPEPLKDELRKNSFWPKEPVVERFNICYWLWGQTTSYLISVLQGFGWKLESGQVANNFCGEHWEFPLLRFAAPTR